MGEGVDDGKERNKRNKIGKWGKGVVLNVTRKVRDPLLLIIILDVRKTHVLLFLKLFIFPCRGVDDDVRRAFTIRGRI